MRFMVRLEIKHEAGCGWWNIEVHANNQAEVEEIAERNYILHAHNKTHICWIREMKGDERLY